MNATLPLLAALLLAPLAALHAADATVSHRVLCTDYKGNRVVILSAKGDIESEFPAKKPQDCWLLPNGNVLFSQKTVSQTAENEIPGNPLKGEVLR
jgi:hypothetical protein